MPIDFRRVLSENHVYRDLTIALVLFFTLGPVLGSVIDSPRIEGFLAVGLLVFALYQITRRATDLVIGLVLGVPAIAGSVVNVATRDTPEINAVPTVLSVLFVGFLVWRILTDVIGGSRISSERVYGAVCAYLFIGFLFAGVYRFIALIDPGAFVLGDALGHELAAATDDRRTGIFTYFSFVTMSTLGYGDISPVSTAARSLSWAQAVLGQLYLAITIAALVGTHIAESSQNDESS